MRDDRIRLVRLFGLLLLAGCFLIPHARLQDGSLRFTRESDGTVRDNYTGLVWLEDANVGEFEDHWDGVTWDQANAFITTMNSGQRPNQGYGDWRLPTAGELQAFLCGGVRKSFENVANTAYWSATQGRRVTAASESAGGVGPLGYAWAVDTNCTAFPLNKTAKKRIWPVRGPRARQP